MILVYTSVWIDFFSSPPGPAGQELKRLIVEAEPLALTGIVAVEILQGLARNVERIEYYLSQWVLLEPQGYETYLKAAKIFRLGRSRGMTFTTSDVLIATLALENGASVFSLDQDFRSIARLTKLALH